MKYLAIVAALGMTGCCATPAPSPAAAPVAAPCAPAPKVAAPAAAPFGCNANAKATGSPVAMSTVTMPSPLAKMAVVPPNVVVCVFGFLKCLVDTLVAPLKP